MKNRQHKNIRIEERAPTVEEYQLLRNQTNWGMVRDPAVKIALKNHLYSVVVFDGPNMIGMGRVVGDGAIYFYIQDVIVHEDYRSKGVGGLIMDHIEHYFETMAPQHAFIGLMAAEGTTEFYKRFGFIERKNNSPGMFKILMTEN
ncbi:GNAT family N-acetyltransferase [Allomuricauda sp. SCSIO 65647]|uniref:GNAT family N-acetyltransferase n=1 Tax=Allomuricauda sp. SCSIO 65647 TaxID=2908843 RepID=UPI001F2FB8A7|nr:GNAT family N-acetyltransferase [Muricauda sp. SCSIO 65647]UJH67796.1 GNAT family N-acetyltransferase [Muricauda sp. SCSIO 65647]